MSTHNEVTSRDEQGQSPSGARRRFLTGLVTGGLVASLLAGGAVMYAHAHSRPGGWFGARPGPRDPGKAGERAALATDWILRGIDASEQQRQQVQAIVQAAVKDLWPLRDQHRRNLGALREALVQPTVDRGTLEEIRLAELGLAEAASSRLVEAIAEAAEVLTPEQRAKLGELAARWHR